MLFNSIEFLIFFPLVTLLYFYAPPQKRWLLLLAASCFFYMFFRPIYILILFFTIIIDFIAGILIEKASTKKHKRNWLVISIIANVFVLVIFKYFNFISANVNQLLGLFYSSASLGYLDILLPIGLSFHTFQAMSYTIEVYRGNQKAEKHFGIYSLYVMFYPQLVAGPIERPQNILHQFHEKKVFDYDRIREGLLLMAWGFFKKIVIADRVAVYANLVFNDPEQFNGLSTLLAVFFFSIQIYCDFSGYSDIALGAAKVMGYDLMKNFDRPYASTSISEFWSRWHISLSTWFRDYVYIPLGGNRRSALRTYFNIFIIFLLSGIWHGANWTFVVWGGLHGAYVVIDNVFKKLQFRIRLPNLVKGAFIFSLVSVSWIYFRADSIGNANLMMMNVMSGFSLEFGYIYQSIVSVTASASVFIECAVLITFMFLLEFIHSKYSLLRVLYIRKFYLRWPIYYALLLSIVIFGNFSNNQFIYFQF